MALQSNYKKEDAYKTLELINTWIGNVDTKISFALAFEAVLIGFVFNKDTTNIFKNILDLKIFQIRGEEVLEIIFVIALYLMAFISTIFLLLGIKGKVKNSTGDQSVFFFGTIDEMTEEEYINKTSNMTEDEVVKDLKQQIYINSKICIKKFNYYNMGLKFLILTVVLYFICFIFQ